MILKINHKSNINSIKVFELFQSSYIVEARILNTINFPPLQRSVYDIRNSNTIFYSYLIKELFVSVIEIKKHKNYIHIQSLVVHPHFFRKGIASKMIDFIISSYKTKYFTIETGVDNYPARNLYEKLNFLEVKQWDTSHGIRKVQYKLNFL